MWNFLKYIFVQMKRHDFQSWHLGVTFIDYSKLFFVAFGHTSSCCSFVLSAAWVGWGVVEPPNRFRYVTGEGEALLAAFPSLSGRWVCLPLFFGRSFVLLSVEVCGWSFADLKPCASCCVGASSRIWASPLRDTLMRERFYFCRKGKKKEEVVVTRNGESFWDVFWIKTDDALIRVVEIRGCRLSCTLIWMD